MGRPDKYEHDYPSVTEITGILDKPGLRYWYGKFGTPHCEKVKKESQEIGHGVHAGIDRYIKGEPFSKASEGLSDQQKLMLSRLVEWVEEKQLKYIGSEETLYSKKHRFAGTYDCVAEIDGKLWLVDWKTDSTPGSKADEKDREFSYKLQTAAYAILYEENKKVKLNQSIVVRASKKLELKYYTYDSLTRAKSLFLKLRDVYKDFKGK